MDSLEDAISDEQLCEWCWFYELEPWGAEVEFLRAGIVASTIVNASPNRKPRARAASPKDFMPSTFSAPSKRMDSDEIREALRGVFGDRVKARKKKD